jgi:hypothetical protein
VATQATFVVPSPTSVPAVGLHPTVIEAPAEQLSRTDTPPATFGTVAWHRSADAGADVGAGQAAVGGVVSFTVTVKEHSEPAPVQDTGEVPTGKKSPEATGLSLVVQPPPQGAATSNATFAPHCEAPRPVLTVMGSGQVSVQGTAPSVKQYSPHALPGLAAAATTTNVCPDGTMTDELTDNPLPI